MLSLGAMEKENFQNSQGQNQIIVFPAEDLSKLVPAAIEEGQRGVKRKAKQPRGQMSKLKRTKQEEGSVFETLPPEIKHYFLSYVFSSQAILEAKNLAEVFSRMATLRLINREVDALVEDRVFVKAVVKDYMRLRPDDAQHEFLAACATGNIQLFEAFMLGEIDLGVALASFNDEDLESSYRWGESFRIIQQKVLKIVPEFKELKKFLGMLTQIGEHMIALKLRALDPDLAQSEIKISLGNLGLMLGASSGCHAIIQRLLLYDSILIPAVYCEKSSLVTSLVQNGSNVNVSDACNGTLLLYAVINYDIEMVTYLLNNGADVNPAPCALDETIIKAAFNCTSIAILKILLDRGLMWDKVSCSECLFASLKNDIELVARLLHQVTDEAAVISEIKAALLWAVRLEYFELISYLLHCAAECNLIDEHGLTDIAQAVQAKDLEAIKALIAQAEIISADNFAMPRRWVNIKAVFNISEDRQRKFDEALRKLVQSSMADDQGGVKRKAKQPRSQMSKLKRTKRDEGSVFETLPPEIKHYLLKYVLSTQAILEAKNLVEVFSRMATLRLINREVDALVADQVFVKAIVKEYLRLRPDDAQHEFLAACATGNMQLFEAFMCVIDLENTVVTINEEDLVDSYGHGECFGRIKQKVLKMFPEFKGLADFVAMFYLIEDHMVWLRAIDHNQGKADKRISLGQLGLMLGLSSSCNVIIQRLIACDDIILIPAANCEKLSIVTLLIQNGSNVNSSDVYNGTPLLYAIINNDSQLVAYLLNNGADVNPPAPVSSLKETIIKAVLKRDNIAILKMLLDRGLMWDKVSCSECLFASLTNDIPLVARLLHQVTDKAAVISEIKTALLWAVRLEYFDLISYLIHCAAECNLIDEDGLMNIAQAVQAKDLDAIKVLINQAEIISAHSFSMPTDRVPQVVWKD